MKQEDLDLLEGLVDKYGLHYVLVGLSGICGEKADHLEANWGDELAAEEWLSNSKVIDKAVVKITL